MKHCSWFSHSIRKGNRATFTQASQGIKLCPWEVRHGRERTSHVNRGTFEWLFEWMINRTQMYVRRDCIYTNKDVTLRITDETRMGDFAWKKGKRRLEREVKAFLYE